MKGKIMARTGGRRTKFCADTRCSVNIMPAKIAQAGGLKWGELDWDESTYKSVTNQVLTIIGQTQAYVKLDLVKTTICLEFLICTDDGDEALLCLDTLKDLTVVPHDFPNPINKNLREPKIRRLKDFEAEEEE